jgi:hypothetical protein
MDEIRASTGEVKRDFIMLYVKSLGMLKELSRTERNVLDRLLWKHLRYDNEIRLGVKDRQDICEYAETNAANLANCLSSLKKKEILFSSMRNIYTLNPRLAFRGKEQNRLALIVRLAGSKAGEISLEEMPND